ncbi:MAG: serine/threonine protein kinase [Myxococcales bacterium]|nr:serine/threonine protein kinase [Myxococcales bacterium]
MTETRVASRTRGTSSRILREYLQRDAPLRESSVALWMSAVGATSMVVCLALSVKIGWRLSAFLVAFLAVVTGYYSVLRAALKRGWYHRVIPWVNVLFEVSIPSLIFVIDVKLQSAEYALTAPPLAIWGSLVALSGLRTSRPLAIAAGFIAATEYLLLYFFVARPLLPAHTLVTLGTEMMLTRTFLLFCAGIVTAIFAGHLTRKAEEALASVRERDWMGKYIMHERVGTGGMAEVFRATYSPEGGFEKRVAIKRVLPSFARDSEFVAMFRAEAELGSWLAHPNIVQILDLGSHDETLYLAMEFIDGVTLKRVIKAHPDGMPPRAVAVIALAIGRALEYTHAFKKQGELLGLVHRDVNPPNVLLSKMGEVKLSDFGIARAADNDDTVRGKLSYLAPEQAARKPVDGRADLFALGLTLHECLTGKAVFAMEPAVAMHLVQTDRVANVREVNPRVPEALAAVIYQLTEIDPKRRFESAASLVAALQLLPEDCAPNALGESELAQCVARSLEARVPSLEPRRPPPLRDEATTMVRKAN